MPLNAAWAFVMIKYGALQNPDHALTRVPLLKLNDWGSLGATLCLYKIKAR